MKWIDAVRKHCGGGCCVDAYDAVEDGECFCSCKGCQAGREIEQQLKELEVNAVTR